jgi:hypothetical protein
VRLFERLRIRVLLELLVFSINSEMIVWTSASKKGSDVVLVIPSVVTVVSILTGATRGIGDTVMSTLQALPVDIMREGQTGGSEFFDSYSRRWGVV